MHELLLLSSQPVPPASCHLILSVLAGFAAAQPTPYSALHLIFAPVRAPNSAGSATRSSLPSQMAAQQKISSVPGDLFYVQLVGRLHEKTRGGNASEGEATGEDMDVDGEEERGRQNATAKKADSVVDLDAHPWTLEFRDLPEPGKARPVASRLMASIPFTGGDPVGFVRGMGYEFQSAHLQHGQQLIHGAIQVLLVQILPIPSAPRSSSQSGMRSRPTLPTTIPDPSTLAPLDSSGAKLLQASVRVADDSQPELLTQGGAELTALKATLKGVVELDTGERMAFDPRVKV